jgi:hypothetical protein
VGDVLAVWVLLHPSKLRDATTWLQGHGFQDGFGGSRAELTLEQVLQLQEAMGYDDQRRPYVRVIKQGHGDIVHVAAGWMHQVLSVRACIKLAWEEYRPQQL